MSKFGYLERSGLNGISLSKKELHDFADFMSAEYGDMYIPLPNISEDKQKQLIEGCPMLEGHGNSGPSVWWETDKGSHGVCCGVCGTVTQWG